MSKYNTTSLIIYGFILIRFIPIIVTILLVGITIYYLFGDMRTLHNDFNPILMILGPLGSILFGFILGLLLSYRLKVLWRNRAFKHSLDTQSLYNQSLDNKLLIREEEKKFGLYELQTNNEKAYWENIKKEIISGKNISINNIDDIGPRKVSYSGYQNLFIILAGIICITIAAYFIYLKEPEKEFIYLFGGIGLVSLSVGIYRSLYGNIFSLSDYGINKKSHGLLSRDEIDTIIITKKYRRSSSWYELYYTYKGGSETINISELDIGLTELEWILKQYKKKYELNF